MSRRAIASLRVPTARTGAWRRRASSSARATTRSLPGRSSTPTTTQSGVAVTTFSGRRGTTTTVHRAFSATVAAVDPSNRPATHPIPADPTQTIAAVARLRDQCAVRRTPEFVGFHLHGFAGGRDSRRRGAQCALPVLDLWSIEVERDRAVSCDADGVHEAKWCLAVDGLIDGPQRGGQRGLDPSTPTTTGRLFAALVIVAPLRAAWPA